ncbi:MAG: class A beta-lactamase-related serine hydrolase [Firmicutes bacterium]|jgi:beta-lactamase class A|nr:class A beta-lactamase-related serine hydrolase [Bacillota bacterium]
MLAWDRTAPAYAPLEARVREFLEADPATYGVHFLDLASRTGFGLNALRPLPQASTVKVPIVLYLNRLVARGVVCWNDAVAYNPETDYRGGAGALQFFAKEGSRYSLRLLSNLVITLSDNIAKAMLVRFLGADNIRRFMASLGASQPHVAGEEPTTALDMTIYLLGVLGLARELPGFGCRMLDDLANTIWNEGLPGRLPRGVIVAHKEGDITGVSDDVGIVFARRPYILSVLSEGQADIEAGFRTIAAVSEIVYDYQERLSRSSPW